MDGFAKDTILSSLEQNDPPAAVVQRHKRCRTDLLVELEGSAHIQLFSVYIF
jgi:hypothetical protein